MLLGYAEFLALQDKKKYLDKKQREFKYISITSQSILCVHYLCWILYQLVHIKI